MRAGGHGRQEGVERGRPVWRAVRGACLLLGGREGAAEDPSLLVRRARLEEGAETGIVRVALDVLKELELPVRAVLLLARASLALGDLDRRLGRRSLVEVAGPDAVGDVLPEPPALPLVLGVERADRHLLLGRRRVGEDRLSLVELGRLVPLAVGRQDGPATGVGERRLERVSLAGQVALA